MESDTKRSWKVLNKLLGEEGAGSSRSPNFKAEEYYQYTEEKIKSIYQKMATAETVTYSLYSGPSLIEYTAPSIEEVMARGNVVSEQEMSCRPIADVAP